MFYSCEKSILKKSNLVHCTSHWEISVSCTIQEIDNVMYNTLLSSFCSIMIFFCQVVAHGRLKTIIENCKLLALKVVVVAYKTWVLTRGSKRTDVTWKLLVLVTEERWSQLKVPLHMYQLLVLTLEKGPFSQNSLLCTVKLHYPCGKITELQMYLTGHSVTAGISTQEGTFCSVHITLSIHCTVEPRYTCN